MSVRWIQHGAMLSILALIASAAVWVGSARANSAATNTRSPSHQSVCAPPVRAGKNLMTAVRLCRPWA